jgi:hypothetical protein
LGRPDTARQKLVAGRALWLEQTAPRLESLSLLGCKPRVSGYRQRPKGPKRRTNKRKTEKGPLAREYRGQKIAAGLWGRWGLDSNFSLHRPLGDRRRVPVTECRPQQLSLPFFFLGARGPALSQADRVQTAACCRSSERRWPAAPGARRLPERGVATVIGNRNSAIGCARRESSGGGGIPDCPGRR